MQTAYDAEANDTNTDAQQLSAGPSYLAQTDPNEADEPRTAPIVQRHDGETVEGVRLTFIVPNETENRGSDGLVVQHIDENEFERVKSDRVILYHDKKCLLSAFLYFTTITSFVYLAILWIKQRMHLHLDQLQLW